TSRHSEDTAHQRHLTARAMARELTEQGADEATCRAVLDAVDGAPPSPGPDGRVLFARDGEVVLEAPLARPPHGGDWARWAPLPRVAPLLELLGEDPVAVWPTSTARARTSSCAVCSA